jgi:nitroreductase
VLANALRAPSAGFSQGWAFLALTDRQDRARFWPFVPTRVENTPTMQDAPDLGSDRVPADLRALYPHPAAEVVAWVDRHPGDQVFITAVTAAELLYGVARVPDGRRKQVLATSLPLSCAQQTGGRRV